VLDDFYREKLPSTAIGRLITEVRPVGGQRKVDALTHFAEAQNQPLSKWVAVGDSITDFKMLRAVNEAGGLSIAFNSNEYALPYATMGLASTSIADLLDVLREWAKSGRKAGEKMVKDREKTGGTGDTGNFQWLDGRKDIESIVALHKRIRRVVREEAAGLG
jgi:energy-converting hydrogenase A subunit R